MPLYMTQCSYTPAGLEGLVERPEARREYLSKVVEGLGGRLVAFYFAFGEYDAVGIVEMPDHVKEAALVLGNVASGHLAAVKTTPLITVEEAVAAMEIVGTMPHSVRGG